MPFIWCLSVLQAWPEKQRTVSGRVSRSSQNLNIPLFKSKTGQRSFSYRMVNIWNNLPSEIKLAKATSRKTMSDDELRWVMMSYFIATSVSF